MPQSASRLLQQLTSGCVPVACQGAPVLIGQLRGGGQVGGDWCGERLIQQMFSCQVETFRTASPRMAKEEGISVRLLLLLCIAEIQGNHACTLCKEWFGTGFQNLECQWSEGPLTFICWQLYYLKNVYPIFLHPTSRHPKQLTLKKVQDKKIKALT